MRHIGIKLTSFTFVDYLFRHFIRPWPIESRSVCFSHNGPRGRMMTTGPRVDIIKDYLTFFWCYTLLTDSSRAFSIKCPFMTVKALDRRTIYRASSSSSGNSLLRMYAMYGIVQSGVMTKTSMIRSTTAGTSTSVGSVALFGCGASSVKGSS